MTCADGYAAPMSPYADPAPQTQRPIEVGDYVRCAPTPDVWRVVRLSGDEAVLSPSSIALAGRPRRAANVAHLSVVTALSTTPIDEAF